MTARAGLYQQLAERNVRAWLTETREGLSAMERVACGATVERVLAVVRTKGEQHASVELIMSLTAEVAALETDMEDVLGYLNSVYVRYTPCVLKSGDARCAQRILEAIREGLLEHPQLAFFKDAMYDYMVVVMAFQELWSADAPGERRRFKNKYHNAEEVEGALDASIHRLRLSLCRFLGFVRALRASSAVAASAY